MQMTTSRRGHFSPSPPSPWMCACVTSTKGAIQVATVRNEPKVSQLRDKHFTAQLPRTISKLGTFCFHTQRKSTGNFHLRLTLNKTRCFMGRNWHERLKNGHLSRKRAGAAAQFLGMAAV